VETPGRKVARLADSAPFWVSVSVAILLAVFGVGYFYGRRHARDGQLQLTTVPPDATVLVDGRRASGHSPFSIVEKTGLHKLEVTRAGYVRGERNVWIPAHRRVRETVVLTPADGASP